VTGHCSFAYGFSNIGTWARSARYGDGGTWLASDALGAPREIADRTVPTRARPSTRERPAWRSKKNDWACSIPTTTRWCRGREHTAPADLDHRAVVFFGQEVDQDVRYLTKRRAPAVEINCEIVSRRAPTACRVRPRARSRRCRTSARARCCRQGGCCLPLRELVAGVEQQAPTRDLPGSSR